MAGKKRYSWQLPTPQVAEEIRKWIMFFVGIGLLVWWGIQRLSIENSWLGIIALLLGFGVISPSKWKQATDEDNPRVQRPRTSREEMGDAGIHTPDDDHVMRSRFGHLLRSA